MYGKSFKSKYGIFLLSLLSFDPEKLNEITIIELLFPRTIYTGWG